MQFLKIYATLVILCCYIRLSHNALFYPSNSAYGIIAAIAVPLDLPHRNVFISYNFEANYNLPETWNLPPYAIGVEEEDLFEDAARYNNGKDCTNCTSSSAEETVEDVENEENMEENDIDSTTTSYRNETETNSRRKRGRKRREIPSLLTRTHFYHILIDKFERSGFEGEPCLLRLICETNASELGEINGVLGNLIHIMFSPTTSKNENLPLAYYQAEVDGIHDQCHHYEEECSESILDLISVPIHEYIEQMEMEIHNLGK
ncbi:uncharacterized protein LOC111683438 [Lucilia cuprina]|uniref:uncharacterized protein LOC111683438 n=1 Tax=Lucilia cuprina TaxID=7375 RepID=UPI001F0586B8|nr:uncharacterized protein LOC111683438 [Lucilia cuprina]